MRTPLITRRKDILSLSPYELFIAPRLLYFQSSDLHSLPAEGQRSACISPGALAPDSGVSDTRGPCISARPVGPTFIRNLNNGRAEAWSATSVREDVEKHGNFKRLDQLESPHTRRENKGIQR